MTFLIARAPSRTALRAWGAAFAVASVVLPALPLGPLFAQPPLPLAALWAAYGWAAEDETGVRAPIALALIGLLHDQMAGGPYGLFMALYLAAYVAGRGVAVVMSAPNILSLWGGFVVTAGLTVAVAHVLARWALGPNVNVWPYAQAAAITALLFPLVRPLYMSAGPALQQARQRR
ncbi:MAG: hypothetical protein NW206_13115 [Hyphomonadaceae bacterium]|nr:hypothetical protein [Hyphomonadaceae bacterium]